jgi:RNA-binding protein
MNPLSSKRRSELRAQAHKLSPTVLIGDKGLTDEVLAEVDRALKAHELVKVRAATDDRDARNAWMESICEKLEAHPVQQIGKVLVVFRENPKEAKAKPKRDSRPLAPRAGAGNDAKRRPRNDGKRGAEDTRKRAPVDDGRKESSATRKRRTRDDVKRTSRPRSRTPSPLPESGPRRRRPRTSR